jgi:hypothetical protein
MLNSFVAVENLPRLQCVLTRDDPSGFKGFKASVRNPGPKIDEVIFLVGFRHLKGESQVPQSPSRSLPKPTIMASGHCGCCSAIHAIHKRELRRRFPAGVVIRAMQVVSGQKGPIPNQKRPLRGVERGQSKEATEA